MRQHNLFVCVKVEVEDRKVCSMRGIGERPPARDEDVLLDIHHVNHVRSCFTRSQDRI